eukprot:Gb_02552 [translate_table: standard]
MDFLDLHMTLLLLLLLLLLLIIILILLNGVHTRSLCLIGHLHICPSADDVAMECK